MLTTDLNLASCLRLRTVTINVCEDIRNVHAGFALLRYYGVKTIGVRVFGDNSAASKTFPNALIRGGGGGDDREASDVPGKINITLSKCV
jgi:hypothetical protein